MEGVDNVALWVLESNGSALVWSFEPLDPFPFFFRGWVQVSSVELFFKPFRFVLSSSLLNLSVEVE